MDKEQTIRITLRLPEPMHQQLVEEADDASRSLNGEIVARLAATLSGEAPALPQSLRDEITERANTAATTFELELIRAVVAGLSPGAPAVLVVEHNHDVSIRSAGALLEAAVKQLPPDTMLRLSKRKK
ncbi:Arc family DNA-binding protein [Paraburkholderia terrae]|uniref:Arc family DNA-binding protein n=1 Tax=Paraburkholderia terrae TaxID=311230 RepID=UPI00296ADBC1|nr:Arc family DNA-binding protein [Paraburkholderia terrae]MDW3655433.1 Arc family DNA-binding protein [Paraburkholderia terrae]